MMNKTKYIGLFLLLLPFGVISYIRNTGNFITDPITLGLTGCVLTMSFIVGVFIMFIYTVAYIIVFCISPDWNWIDIFNGTSHISFNINW